MYEQNRPNDRIDTFMKLSDHITAMCQCKEVVLMIDEVDKVSNNTVFLNFLSMLRNKYLARKSGKDQTFHSVILSGVEGNIYNSPWNIAVDFNIDMAFNPDEIASMLVEYEGDHHTGMDISAVSLEIFTYTGGYPFLVSRVCQYIDNMTNADWSAGGVRSAAQAIVNEKNTLFDDIIKNLENDAELSDTAYKLLILGEVIPFMPYDSIIGFGVIYGFFKKTENGDSLIIANKIFELLLTNYFVSKDLRRKNVITSVLQRDLLTTDGGFDMELCLRKFAGHYFEIYNELDAGFLERHGRLLFLSYLKPLINGQGYYHIESQFTDARRMDVVVDFGRQQFIIELKIWRGEQYQKDAYAQLGAYLKSKNAGTGYLLTFDLRKGKNNVDLRKGTNTGAADNMPSARWLAEDGVRIFEIIV